MLSNKFLVARDLKKLRCKLAAKVVGVENALERVGPGRKATAEVTQVALARRLGIHKTTYQRWESRGDPPEHVVELLQRWVADSSSRTATRAARLKK